MPEESTKIILPEKEIPRHWYNILSDLPTPLPPAISPVTGKPVTFEESNEIMPMNLILQEGSKKSSIKIPEEVLKIYNLWRPSPLYRARRLEEKLGTPAKIYYKYEGVSPTGSHKLNTAVPQAYYNKQEGINKLCTDTGAGQWGSALALACNFFDMELHVYMVKISFKQKPYRKTMMQTWGADVTASPSTNTESGRAVLTRDPDCRGSIAIAASEASEEARGNKDVNYASGSVFNHVCLHQTIIGLEAQKQMALAGEYPDVLIGCVGGGSNFAGIAFPFVRDKIHGKNIKILAVEPSACPTLTSGKFAYDYGDSSKITPIIKMYTLGYSFVPAGIHAGGLRYHGMSPIVSLLHHEGIVESISYHQNKCFEAAILFSKSEGILPAPESSHAIKAAVDEALLAKEEGKEKTILFCLTGHGHFDLTAYEQYLSGSLEDYDYPRDEIEKALEHLPQID
ncbi:MAG: TrpB-like pyridoxal phosphate-dependent enzyme [bacterium]|nr:TrpB-like pyridoxal phosphate-dependent enzyme [bacterium]